MVRCAAIVVHSRRRMMFAPPRILRVDGHAPQGTGNTRLSSASRWAAFVPFLWACSSSVPATDVGPSEWRQQNVLVIDDGFDLSLPVFAGKIAGRYTMDCSAARDGDGQTGDDSDAEVAAPDARNAKQVFIAALTEGDHSCHLRPGLSFERPTALEGIAKYRERWNTALQQGRSILDEFTLTEAMDIEMAFASVAGHNADAFHGTATAGAIAYANPEARLVVVQTSLASQTDEQTPVVCPTQADVDATTALLLDADVRRAYIERPRADIDRELDELMVATQIGIWSKSFGKPSRAAAEAALLEAGCGRIDLSQYMAAKGELDAAYEARQPVRDVLQVSAAGNDGTRVDAPRDQEGCRTERPNAVVVGSYGSDFERSAFSNYGGCVDVLAPGEDIIASLPDGWLMFMSGTSFSTPLVARWASLDHGSSFSAETARTRILALRDEESRIPQNRFPEELLYRPRGDVVGYSAVGPMEGATPTPDTASRPTGGLEWRQAFWPLHVVRSAARSRP
jgi:subtilisin family serine protease